MDISNRSTIAAALASLAPCEGTNDKPRGAAIINFPPSMRLDAHGAIGQIAQTLGYATTHSDFAEATHALTGEMPTLVVVSGNGTSARAAEIQELVRLATGGPVAHAVCVISQTNDDDQTDNDLVRAVGDAVSDTARAGSGRNGVAVINLRLREGLSEASRGRVGSVPTDIPPPTLGVSDSTTEKTVQDVASVRREPWDPQGITYEGPDIDALRELDQMWRDELHLPGERVRLRELGPCDHSDDLRSRLGDGLLEVSRTVVSDEKRQHEYTESCARTTYEDESRGANTMYEFRGVNGRFATERFQHQRGEEHVHGAIIADDERMWFVPLKDKRADGPAREITSRATRQLTRTRDLRSPKPPLSMIPLGDTQNFFRRTPALGSFTMRPQTYGDSTGPVELVAAGWIMDLSDAEHQVARDAVAKVERTSPDAVFEQKPGITQSSGAMTVQSKHDDHHVKEPRGMGAAVRAALWGGLGR